MYLCNSDPTVTDHLNTHIGFQNEELCHRLHRGDFPVWRHQGIVKNYSRNYQSKSVQSVLWMSGFIYSKVSKGLFYLYKSVFQSLGLIPELVTTPFKTKQQVSWESFLFTGNYVVYHICWFQCYRAISMHPGNHLRWFVHDYRTRLVWKKLVFGKFFPHLWSLFQKPATFSRALFVLHVAHFSFITEFGGGIIF